MNKLKLIIKREYLAKVRNKTFIIMTFLSPLLMIGMIALVFLLTKSSMEKKTTVAYVDESGLFSAEDFKDGKTVHFENLTEVGLDKAKIIVEESSHEGLLYIPKKDSIQQVANGIEFYSVETPGMVTISSLESILERKLRREKMLQLHIDLDQLEKAKVNVDIKMSNFSGERSSKMINGIKIGIGMAAGYLIMMFILIYGAMVMRSVIEEKTSRIIEVIISSVKPFQLMLGKIIGTAAAGLTQFLIWAIVMVIIMTISSMVFGVDMTSSNMTAQQMEQLAQNDTQFIMTELFNLPLVSMFVYFLLYFLSIFYNIFFYNFFYNFFSQFV